MSINLFRMSLLNKNDIIIAERDFGVDILDLL